MVSWAELERSAPEFAAAGRRLLVQHDGIAVAFMATVSADGRPRQAPVCPIFCGEDLYVSAGMPTAKVRDLRANGAYSLHAFLGANDEEFQLQGVAPEVLDPEERSAVHRAIPFPAFGKDDPIFRLGIDRVLWIWWERVGQPDTRPVRRRWRPGHGEDT